MQSICCICLNCSGFKSVLLQNDFLMTATSDRSPFCLVYFFITRASKSIKILFHLNKVISHIWTLKYNMYTAILSYFLVQCSSGSTQPFQPRALCPRGQTIQCGRKHGGFQGRRSKQPCRMDSQRPEREDRMDENFTIRASKGSGHCWGRRREAETLYNSIWCWAKPLRMVLTCFQAVRVLGGRFWEHHLSSSSPIKYNNTSAHAYPRCSLQPDFGWRLLNSAANKHGDGICYRIFGYKLKKWSGFLLFFSVLSHREKWKSVQLSQY